MYKYKFIQFNGYDNTHTPLPTPVIVDKDTMSFEGHFIKRVYA